MKFFIKKLSAKKFANILAVSAILFGSCPTISVFADSTVYYNSSFDKTENASIPSNEFNIKVVPSKTNVNVGEEFYVDFIIENNPGIAGFGIQVEYNSDIVAPLSDGGNLTNDIEQINYKSGRYDEGIITSEEINVAIENSKTRNINDLFLYNKLLLNGGKLTTTTDDGIFMRVNFKAIKSGSTEIQFNGCNGTMFIDIDAETIPVYVKNTTVTVSGNASQTGQNTETDNTTKETTKEATTEGVVDEETETTTQTAQSNQSADEDGIKYSIPAQGGAIKNFADMSLTPWAKDAVGVLSSAGIVNGVDANNFAPKSFTTRGDFAVVISRLLGLDGNAENSFNDVADSKYYAKYIALANKIGVINGIGNGKFNPDVTISRQDVMVIVSRTLEKLGKLQKADISVLNSFKDNSSVSGYAKESVANLIGMGIVKGSDGNINPKANITRAEMAVIMHALYNIAK